MNCPGKRSTSSTSTSDNADSALAHHTKDALSQVKEEVAKVYSVNKGTEKKIAELIGYLDEAPTEVGIVVSSYTRALFAIVSLSSRRWRMSDSSAQKTRLRT